MCLPARRARGTPVRRPTAEVFSPVTVDELNEPERRSVLCTTCADILSQLDDSEEDVRALRLEMLSDEQVPDAGATLRYDRERA